MKAAPPPHREHAKANVRLHAGIALRDSFLMHAPVLAMFGRRPSVVTFLMLGEAKEFETTSDSYYNEIKALYGIVGVI